MMLPDTDVRAAMPATGREDGTTASYARLESPVEPATASSAAPQVRPPASARPVAAPPILGRQVGPAFGTEAGALHFP